MKLFNRALILLCVVICLLFLIGIFLYMLNQKESGHSAFDSFIWKNEKLAQSPDYPRIRMVDDLLARYPLVGMFKGQIDELLGVPPQTEYFKNYDYVYWLGPERGFMGIDSEWLCIKFEVGKVQEFRILTD